MKSLLPSTIAILMTAPSLAAAEARHMPRGTIIIVPQAEQTILQKPEWGLPRDELEQHWLCGDALEQCNKARAESETRECEGKCASDDSSILEWLGWPVVITGVVVALAGGVAMGFLIGRADQGDEHRGTVIQGSER